MNDKRKEYLKKWREDNKEHIKHYKKEYAKTHDSSFKKLQDKYEQLQQENKKLNGAIQTYDILLKSNVEENKQLKDNWNKLKEWVNKHYDYYMNNEDYVGGRLCFNDMKDKMQELEGNDSNDSN